MQGLYGTPEEQERNALKMRIQERAVRYHDWQTCLNCEHYDKQEGTCSLYGGATPPATTVVLGCVSWIHEIPF